jgi:FAD/FMN-containing dehydrogenase
VTTIGNRYVQGGGCATVGVAGLVQSGGFGSFSKLYGTAAAALIEAEIVTADGVVRIANACTNPDLFWGLKGGGGGSLGVVTRMTLRTRELPKFFGGAGAKIKAHSASAFHALIAKFISFYAEKLLNPHWGESIKIKSDDTLEISMVSQGLDSQQATEVWKPFMDWVAAASSDYTFDEEPSIGSTAARNWWDVAYRKIHSPDSMVADSRQGASPTHAWWGGDGDQVGVFLHGFHSAWLPATLIDAKSQHRLVDALFDSSRQWEVQLHFNKGLAGAPAEEVKAARDTATNPAVLDAFALAIIAGGARPDITTARKHAASIDKAMDELRKVAPHAGSYVSESDYFEKSWQRAFWGGHYPRLAAVKDSYDPQGLFFVHHGVGSEHWSEDGFTPVG